MPPEAGFHLATKFGACVIVLNSARRRRRHRQDRCRRRACLKIKYKNSNLNIKMCCVIVDTVTL